MVNIVSQEALQTFSKIGNNNNCYGHMTVTEEPELMIRGMLQNLWGIFNGRGQVVTFYFQAESGYITGKSRIQAREKLLFGICSDGQYAMIFLGAR